MKLSWEDFGKHYGPVLMGPPGRYTLNKELAALLTLANRRQPSKILEMYTAYGHTACALAAACPRAQVYAFDVCKELGGYDPESPFSGEVMSEKDVGSEIAIAAEGVRARVHLAVKNGDRLPEEIRASGPYDVLYIDGDHTWKRVARDTKLALETAADDATLVWDDYWRHCPDVVKYVDALNRTAGDLITCLGETHLCFVTLTREKKRDLLLAAASGVQEGSREETG